jgi:hypothetical protein
MKNTSASSGFGRIRSTLLSREPSELVGLIGELYRLSKENQRFLESKLGDASKQLTIYRQLVSNCLFPDPLSKNSEVRISEAKRAISQYQRATQDSAGTVDLMFVFVEAGTAFANDLGYGDDGFFNALENMLSRALDLLTRGNADFRQSMRPRLARLATSAGNLGWGYGDFVVEAIGKIAE